MYVTLREEHKLKVCENKILKKIDKTVVQNCDLHLPKVILFKSMLRLYTVWMREIRTDFWWQTS
jgi:hypothetical protein